MADLIDEASAIEELQRNTAIQNMRRNKETVSSILCCKCGEPIEEQRRLAVPGCQTCISCQEDLELISKQRGSK